VHIGTFLSGFSRDIILSSELNNMWLLPFLVLQYIIYGDLDHFV
jgi:hypothetical protein